jgi:hypothetical protein
MPRYEVNEDGLRHARKLIDEGTYDVETEWSEVEPSAQDENQVIETKGYEEFGRWYLAVNPEAREETKARYAFPYGDFRKVYRAALIHAKQRASQNDHTEIEKAADELLHRLDSKAKS